MLIILEGNECCYKTTVADKLQDKLKHLQFKYIKGSSFESAKDTNEALFAFYLDIVNKAKSENLIVDRYIVSNLVYATLYKDYSILSEQQIVYILKELEKTGYIIFWLTDNENSIFEKLSSRGDNYIKTKEEVSKINSCYETMFEIVKQYSDKIKRLSLEIYQTSDEIVNIILKHTFNF